MSLKSLLSKLNFCIGHNPIIERRIDFRRFIPEPFKTVLLISADFELAWAWQFEKEFQDPVAEAKKMALRERSNIQGIIRLCDKYKIPITWATVGHLFLDSCKKLNGLAHPDIPRLQHFESDFCKFSGKDWFENDPCSDYKDAPEWYCPDLIKKILDAKVKHEIACHTFSHIDCRDEICPPYILEAELRECKKLAKDYGIELKSFVHPGYTIGNLKVLAEEGFTNFRTNNRNILGYPQKHECGLWEFEQTTEFVCRKGWSMDYHIYRYINIIKRAIKSKTVCVFWFHPSFDPIVVEKIWPRVFQYINENRKDIWVTTHNEYCDWLNKNNSFIES